MNKVNNVKIGNNITLILSKTGSTQKKLAETTGLARPHLTNIINQKTNPTIRVAFKICLALGTPFEQVFYPISYFKG